MCVVYSVIAVFGAYLAIGLACGVASVWANLARFFAAGFRWGYMIRWALHVALIWPLFAAEKVLGRYAG